MQKTVAYARFQRTGKRITPKPRKLPRITPNYPQDGGELPAGNVDGVHDPVVPVDGHCVFDGWGFEG